MVGVERKKRTGEGRRRVRMVVFVLSLFLVLPPVVGAELVDRIVAAVNNDVITLSDLQHAMAFNTALGATGGGPLLEVETREGLINRTLLVQEAIRLRFDEVSERDVDAELEKLRQRFGSDDAFLEFLARTALTEEQLRNLLGERLLVERFVTKKITLFTRVSHDEAQKYFTDHPEEFKGRRFPEVEKEITQRIAEQMAGQQLDLYIADLRSRAEIRLNRIRE
jgi:peptidyl-prolyl cis-trans isomerase SurA